MRDQDGFHLLVRKNGTTDHKKSTVTRPIMKTTINPEKKTVQTKIKNPFKKGSWKSQFWKNLRKYTIGRWISHFHNVNFQNYTIYRKEEDGDYEVTAHHNGLPKSFVQDLKHYDRAYIMIAVGDQMYSRISAKAYKKLMKVEKIAIHFILEALFDGEDEKVTLVEDYNTIDNINDLLSYLNYRRQGVYGVYELQARCCGYTDYFYNFKVLVSFRDGTCKTYKGDMNEFLKDFDLYQL